MKVQITTPSRIHATLIDLNGSLGRIDGSIGITLANPNWKILFETLTKNQLVINVPRQVEGNYIDLLVNDILKQFKLDPLKAPIKITVQETIPRHVGLGSKTQLALALADGISRLLKLEGTPLSKEILASVVNRGGTSGIGVTSYFVGGLIVDGGHEFGTGKEKNAFLPSSASSASPAPVIFREEMPDDWRVIVAIPKLQKGAHDAEEVNVFKNFCPVPLIEVEKLSHIILMKLLPAIKKRKFHEICESINFFQDIGFKKIEVDLRGKSFRDLLKSWQNSGAPCAGMSSFGPAIYSLAENEDQALKLKNAIDDIMKDTAGISFISKMQNSGAIIKYLS